MTTSGDVGRGVVGHPYEGDGISGCEQRCEHGRVCGREPLAHPASEAQLKRLGSDDGLDEAVEDLIRPMTLSPKRLEAQGAAPADHAFVEKYPGCGQWSAGPCYRPGCTKSREMHPVLHHDDPPCSARLRADGYCTACRIIPDMQSLALRMPDLPTPPTPAGEEDLIEHPFIDGLTSCPNKLHPTQQCHDVLEDGSECAQPPSRHRTPPAPPEADGGKLGGLGIAGLAHSSLPASPSPADGAEGLDAAALRVADGALKALHKRLAEVCGERDEAKTKAAHWKRNWEIATDALKAAESALADALVVLSAIQSKTLHKPNSDHREYCNGCGRSPYNVPPHDGDCLVPRLAALIARLKEGGRA